MKSSVGINSQAIQSQEGRNYGLQKVGETTQFSMFEDRRAQTVAQRELQTLADTSPRSAGLIQFQKYMNSGAEARESKDGSIGINEMPIQRQIFYGTQRKTNFANLWKEVSGILKSQGRSVHRRRQELKQLYDNESEYVYTDANDLVAQVYGNYDPPKVTGRVRPGWSSFWSNVPVPPGFHRRHIVLSSLMRNAIYAVTDRNSGDPDSFNTLLSTYQAISGNSSTDINYLESMLVSAMHSNQFNIFLGKGNWNSAIGGLANESYNGEQGLLQKIEMNFRDFDPHSMEDNVNQFWYMMANASVFGNTVQRDVIAHIYSDILDEAMSDIYAVNDWDAYEAAYNHLVSMLKSFYDSMAFDPSQSSNDEYRKLQNSKLSPFHGQFFDLIVTGDLQAFQQVFTQFMALEQYAQNAISTLGPDNWVEAITQRE